MHFNESLKKQIVEEIYKLPASSKSKCIGLAKLLNDLYGEDATLEKAKNQIAHDAFVKLAEFKRQTLQVLFSEPTPANEANAAEFFTPEELASEEYKKGGAAIAQKGWWKQVLLGVPVIEQFVTSEDQPILDFLNDVNVVTKPDSQEFTVEFHFDPQNPFFLNEKLEVTLIFGKDHEHGEDSPNEIKGTPIQWKEGKDITSETKTKKSKGKNKAKKTTTVKKPSFFLIFSNLKFPDEDHECEDEEEHEDPTSDEAIIYQAADIAQTIKESLFVNLIPQLLGLKLEGLSSAGPEDDAKLKKLKAAAGNPECKNQ